MPRSNGWLIILAMVACGRNPPGDVVCHNVPTSEQVGVTHGTIKIRDTSPVPSPTIALDAARNEYEPFQIVIAGGAAGIRDVHVAKVALVNVADSSIVLDIQNIRMFQEGRYNVRWASAAEGDAGYWPDPLIPDVDAYDQQQRHAFVGFDIAANQTRAVWVDIRVPVDQPAGMYRGMFVVTGTNLPAASVTVQLRVRDFTLPSTSTLKSAYNLAADNVTRAHFGGQWCSDFPSAQTDGLLVKYARAALDHRITLMRPTCADPTSDLTHFDNFQGTLLAGTAATELATASATSFRNPRGDTTGMEMLKAHFDARGWTTTTDGSARLLDYTCDEPPAFCDEANWPARAARAQAAGIPNLVTTTYDYLKQKQWVDLVDIVCPVAETMNDAARAEYDEFLALGTTKELWWYQSCDSHGCGGCDAGMATYSERQGMPSYVIDTDARQNRAMEWLSFIFDIGGELYFETAMDLTAGLDWDSGIAYCGFGGSGDGTLFYPGKPTDPRIGGTTDFPLESIRMKLIREGMEDYEYLVLYADKFGRDAAVAKAKSVFPDVFGTKAHPAELLYQVRREIADALEPKSDEPFEIAHAPSAIDLAGDLHEFADVTPIVVPAGEANATFRLLWDEHYLYVVASVDDRDLRARGAGRDGPLYDADSIEVMLDPQLVGGAQATSAMLQVIASVGGDVYDARGAGATGDASFDVPGLVVHAAADGTLNDSAADTGYRIAIALPWQASVEPDHVLGIDLALDNLNANGLAAGDWAGIMPFAQPRFWRRARLVAASCQ